jgi:hypothetical protein
MKKNYMVLIGLLVFSVSAYSDSRLDDQLKQINAELDKQKVEIQRGINDGLITRLREVRPLVKERLDIISSIRKARKDKKITKQEFEKLQGELKTRRGNIDKARKNRLKVDRWAGHVPNNMLWKLVGQTKLIEKQKKNYDKEEMNKIFKLRVSIDAQIKKAADQGRGLAKKEEKIIWGMMQQRMLKIRQFNK